MSNDINELRSIMFETLRAVKTGDEKDIARAKAVSDLSQTILNSAKIEIEHTKAIGGNCVSAFLSGASHPQAKSIAEIKPSVVHRMK